MTNQTPPCDYIPPGGVFVTGLFWVATGYFGQYQAGRPGPNPCQISTSFEAKSNACACRFLASAGREILTLQKAGINSLPAEAPLARMLANIGNMCADRDRLKREQPAKERVPGSRMVMV